MSITNMRNENKGQKTVKETTHNNNSLFNTIQLQQQPKKNKGEERLKLKLQNNCHFDP